MPIELLRRSSDDREFVVDFVAWLLSRDMSKKLVIGRVTKDISAADMAARLGIGVRKLKALESGLDSNWPVGLLQAYADAVGYRCTVTLERKHEG